jgi:hypothetical protein
MLTEATQAGARMLVLDGPPGLPVACNQPADEIGAVPAVVATAVRRAIAAFAR